MRGKVKKEIKKIQEQRITPAYAGKSFVWRYVNHEEVGSPPPMRGKAFVSTCKH